MIASLLATAPALPLHEAGKYVAAAYIVAFVLVLVYVAIMATRLGRVEGDLEELLRSDQRSTALGGSGEADRTAAGSEGPGAR